MDAISSAPAMSGRKSSTDGFVPIQMIAKLAPDLILLDVQMPEIDGFSVVAQLDPAHIPMIVFVTAHDSYALKAFDIHAIDYVLKPVARDRLLQAVSHATARLALPDRPSTSEDMRNLVEPEWSPAFSPQYLDS